MFNDLIPIFGMLTGMVTMVLIGVTIVKVSQGPIGQAIARRLHGKAGPDPELLDEVSQLRDQVAGLEQRLIENEERLDFAERLLSSGTPAGRDAPDREQT
jgi:hypothetical protein